MGAFSLVRGRQIGVGRNSLRMCGCTGMQLQLAPLSGGEMQSGIYLPVVVWQHEIDISSNYLITCVILFVG